MRSSAVAVPVPVRRQLLPCLALLLLAGAASAQAQKYNAVFNFGDSITDTGNLCTSGKPTAITFTQPPYGETYFGTPTCRCSDGRVIVDFLSKCFWGAVPATVQGERHGLQAGREHGHHGGDGHGRALLPRPRPLGQDLEQRAHQLPDPVVPADHRHRVRERLQAVPAGLAGGVRRVRRQRLQRDAVRQLQPGPSEPVHDQDRQHHHQGRGEGGGHGGQGCGGARGAPHRVLPHLPHCLRHQQQRRLRQPRLPPQVQRPLHVPQQPAPGQDCPPPEALRPGGADHVRRLLLRRLRHGPEPKQIRFQRGFRGVLRLRGRQVQLRQQSAVRDAGRGGVRQPGRPPQLGRHPPHRGSIQAHQRRLAQRALLQPAHPPHINIILFIYLLCGAVVVLFIICSEVEFS
uniref:GDSL esterase/lipase n=1 Tax=Triticum urartu TaxID=4572 RepID=A0A8R7P5R1_TRIUA